MSDVSSLGNDSREERSSAREREERGSAVPLGHQLAGDHERYTALMPRSETQTARRRPRERGAGAARAYEKPAANVSARMRRVPSKGTSLERAMTSLLTEVGVAHEDHPSLPGRPDFRLIGTGCSFSATARSGMVDGRLIGTATALGRISSSGGRSL